MLKEIDVSIATEGHSATEPTEEHITASKQAHPLENNGVSTELSDNLLQQAFEVNNSNGFQEQTVQLESIIEQEHLEVQTMLVLRIQKWFSRDHPAHNQDKLPPHRTGILAERLPMDTSNEFGFLPLQGIK